MRLPLLPVEFLTGTVAKDEMIKGSLSCRDLMDEARNYHLHLSNKLDFEYSARTIPRKHTAGCTYVVLFGFEYVITDLREFQHFFFTILNLYIQQNVLHNMYLLLVRLHIRFSGGYLHCFVLLSDFFRCFVLRGWPGGFRRPISQHRMLLHCQEQLVFWPWNEQQAAARGCHICGR